MLLSYQVPADSLDAHSFYQMDNFSLSLYNSSSKLLSEGLHILHAKLHVFVKLISKYVECFV